MKTVKFLASALLVGVLSVSAVFATEKSKEQVSVEQSVKKQVASVVSKISTEETGQVYVYFSVSSENGFQVLKVIGENADLVKAVSAKLKDQKIETSQPLEGVYRVTVRFADPYESRFVSADSKAIFSKNEI